jgi:hypothetical protein
VVRNCYLAVRKAAAVAWEEQQADHIVVIREPGRAITPRDIAAALALPSGAITTIDADPAVARSVDAGLLAQSSLPPVARAPAGTQSRRGPAPAWHPHPGHRPARARRLGPRRCPHPPAARNRRSAAVTTPSPVIPPPQPPDDDVDLNSIVAYNFRAARTLRGWTQKETGRRLEPLLSRRVPQAHVAQLEGAYRGRRRREFDAHELLAFAIAFQLPASGSCCRHRETTGACATPRLMSTTSTRSSSAAPTISNRSTSGSVTSPTATPTPPTEPSTRSPDPVSPHSSLPTGNAAPR